VVNDIPATMDRALAAKELERLAKEIAIHDHLYYNLAQPEISDHEYDELRHLNAKLEAQYPDLVRADSPSLRVGATPQSDFRKITHQRPMVSLEDAFSEGDVISFFDKICRFLNKADVSSRELSPSDTAAFSATDLELMDNPSMDNPSMDNISAAPSTLAQTPSEKSATHANNADAPPQFAPGLDSGVWAELKIDGLSASLVYERGTLATGATRGDGSVGEDVTQNIRTIQDVPLTIPVTHDRLEIRGEVYVPKQTFARLNEERAQNNEPLFSNPRNAAAGSLRQLDAAITRKRRLRFLAYEVIGADFDTQDAAVSYLKHCGFMTIDYARLCNSMHELMAYYQQMFYMRDQIPYDIDGVVYKVNDRKLQARLGNVGRVPRHSLAHKFKAEQTETIVKGISLQVGRTGVLTPVAELAPVVLGGATVSRATLHNKDEVARLDVRIGDTVILQRAGDVIPQVVRVVREKRAEGTQAFEFPRVCVSCARALILDEMRCGGGFACKAQAIQRLSHFAAALEIDGLGERNIEFLYETHRVRDFVDLFLLQQRDSDAYVAADDDLFAPTKPCETNALLLPSSPLAHEPGWGKKSVENLFRAINACKSIPMEKFIFALGIPQVGKQTAALISQHFESLGDLLDCTEEQLMKIDGIGESMATDIVRYLQEQRDLISRLLQHVTLYRNTADSNRPLSGQTVVFTGKLEHISRNEAKAQASRLGAKIGSSVSKGTSFVVAGSDAGQKLAEASRLGVKVMSEGQWLHLVENS
jgi:DNA ligase (NAD+)